jgi:hypothetical protein
LAAGLLIGACALEPDYSGAKCKFGRCPPGYECDPLTHHCVPGDGACAVSNGGCDPHAVCTEVSSTHICACEGVYAGDGLSCALVETRVTSLTLQLDARLPVPLNWAPDVFAYAVVAPATTRVAQVTSLWVISGSATITVNGAPWNQPVSLVGGRGTLTVEVAIASGPTSRYVLSIEPPP